MTEDEAQSLSIGDRVYFVRFGQSGCSLKRGKVTKKGKTQLTVVNDDSQRDNWKPFDAKNRFYMSDMHKYYKTVEEAVQEALVRCDKELSKWNSNKEVCTDVLENRKAMESKNND